jgi:hypothetical protein
VVRKPTAQAGFFPGFRDFKLRQNNQKYLRSNEMRGDHLFAIQKGGLSVRITDAFGCVLS